MFTNSNDVARNAETVNNIIDYALSQEGDFGEGLEFIDKFSENNQRDACALAIELANEYQLRAWATDSNIDRGMLYWSAREELLSRRQAGLLAPIYECSQLYAPEGFYGKRITGQCEFDDWGDCVAEHA